MLQTRELHSHMVQSNGPKASSPLPSEPSSRFRSDLNGTLMTSAGAASWVGVGEGGGVLGEGGGGPDGQMGEGGGGGRKQRCRDSSYLRVLTRCEAFVWIYFFPPFDLRSGRLCGAGAVMS